MDIAVKHFPFEFNECIIEQYANFQHNNDFNINFSKTPISSSYTKATVELILCKEDYLLFEEYLYLDIDRSKKLFVSRLNINSYTKLYICDIISTIKIKHTKNKYYISFDIYAIGEYNGI